MEGVLADQISQTVDKLSISSSQTSDTKSVDNSAQQKAEEKKHDHDKLSDAEIMRRMVHYNTAPQETSHSQSCSSSAPPSLSNLRASFQSGLSSAKLAQTAAKNTSTQNFTASKQNAIKVTQQNRPDVSPSLRKHVNHTTFAAAGAGGSSTSQASGDLAQSTQVISSGPAPTPDKPKAKL